MGCQISSCHTISTYYKVTKSVSNLRLRMSTGHRLPIYRIIYRFSKIIILPSSLPITPHPAPSAHRTILDMINMICQRVSDESWFKKVLSFRWNWWSLKKNLGSALKHAHYMYQQSPHYKCRNLSNPTRQKFTTLWEPFATAIIPQ